MGTHAEFRTVTPLLPAGPGLAEALRCYTEQLGFTLVWESGGMAGVRRGGVEFNLVQNGDAAWAANASASIGVAGLDALYAECRIVPAVRVGPLEIKHWGRREFHMILPSGVCLQFHEADSPTLTPSPAA